MKYLVQRHLHHNGQDFAPNDEISLDGNLADLLLADGAIVEKPPEEPKKAPVKAAKTDAAPS